MDLMWQNVAWWDLLGSVLFSNVSVPVPDSVWQYVYLLPVNGGVVIDCWLGWESLMQQVQTLSIILPWGKDQLQWWQFFNRMTEHGRNFNGLPPFCLGCLSDSLLLPRVHHLSSTVVHFFPPIRRFFDSSFTSYSSLTYLLLLAPLWLSVFTHFLYIFYTSPSLNPHSSSISYPSHLIE